MRCDRRKGGENPKTGDSYHRVVVESTAEFVNTPLLKTTASAASPKNLDERNSTDATGTQSRLSLRPGCKSCGIVSVQVVRVRAAEAEAE